MTLYKYKKLIFVVEKNIFCKARNLAISKECFCFENISGAAKEQKNAFFFDRHPSKQACQQPLILLANQKQAVA